LVKKFNFERSWKILAECGGGNWNRSRRLNSKLRSSSAIAPHDLRDRSKYPSFDMIKLLNKGNKWIHKIWNYISITKGQIKKKYVYVIKIN